MIENIINSPGTISGTQSVCFNAQPSEITGVTTVGDSEVIGRYLVMIDKRYDMQDIQDAIVQYVNFVELDNVIWSTNQTKEIG